MPNVQTFKATAQLQEGVKVITKARQFELVIDEPQSLGGTDTGMNPVEALLASLGACQSIVARVYAPKFDVVLEDFRVTSKATWIWTDFLTAPRYVPDTPTFDIRFTSRHHRPPIRWSRSWHSWRVNALWAIRLPRQ
ncbi:OsmC-like protein [Paenibacillus sp. cl141a]|nr:OsmC-like protein [Paenibacillus sp. cl141a]